jgi:hypothetical protein
MKEYHAEHSRQPDEIGMNLSLLQKRTYNQRAQPRIRVAMANYIRDEFGFDHKVVFDAINSDKKMRAMLPSRGEFDSNPEVGIDRFKIAFYDWAIPAYEIMNEPDKIDSWLPQAFDYVVGNAYSRHDETVCIPAADDSLQGEHDYCPIAFMRNDIRALITTTDFTADAAYGRIDRFKEDAQRRLRCAASLGVFYADEVDELEEILVARLRFYQFE